MIITDNTRIPNVFPRPDEFDKIQRLGGFRAIIPTLAREKEKRVKTNGRIETYIHSDSLTFNKGGVIVKISCETDFAARTQEFIDFCKLTARLCYAIETCDLALDYVSYITEIDPEFRKKLENLEGKLKEKIHIINIYKMVL